MHAVYRGIRAFAEENYVKPKDNNRPRKTKAKNFCALLFHYMEWSVECRYRIMAIYQELDGQELLVLNLDEAVEVQTTMIVSDDGKKKTIYDYLLPFRFREIVSKMT